MPAPEPPEDASGASAGLDLVLNVVRFEREQQLVQFDAIDAKAATMVGFSAAVLALIGTIVVSGDWLWGLWLIPATVSSAHVVGRGFETMRVRKILRQAGADTYREWGQHLSRDGALKRAIADEIRTLDTNDPIVDGKVQQLKATQAAFGCTAYLLVAGIIGVVCHKAILPAT